VYGDGGGVRRFLLLLVLGGIVWVVALGPFGREPRPGISSAAPNAVRDAESSPAGEIETPRPRATPVTPPVAQPVTPAPASDDRCDIEPLLETLLEIEDRAPLAFHDMALEELEAFVRACDDVRRAELVSMERVDRPASERVRGAMLALLAVDETEEAVLEISGRSGEPWRSTLLGLGWNPRGEAASGLVLEPVEFLAKQPRGGRSLLPVTLERMPSPALRKLLRQSLRVAAEDPDELLTRDVMVLVLGTTVDEDEATLDFLAYALSDLSPAMLQIRPSVCFVLAHAASDEAMTALIRFLEDPQIGDHGKALARWWMSEQRGLAGEFAALTAPIRDRKASRLDVMSATGSLLQQLERASPEELRQIEEILTSRIAGEADSTIRLGLVSVLAHAPGGAARLATLKQVLTEDDNRTCRLWAAAGLELTEPPLRTEARGWLEAALQTETDAGVLDRIHQALQAP